MSETISERRMAENQVVFREHNEKVQKGFDRINQIALEEGAQQVLLDRDTPIYFFCECSDNNCRQRIKVSPKVYNQIHQARNNFTIVCGHEVLTIEDVTSTEAEYCVVTKHEMPPETANGLNDTDINNT